MDTGTASLTGWFKSLFHRKKLDRDQQFDYNSPSTSRYPEPSYTWRHSSPALDGSPEDRRIVRRHSPSSSRSDVYLNEWKHRSLDFNSSFQSQASKSSKNSIGSLVDVLKGKLSIQGYDTTVVPVPGVEDFPVLSKRAQEIVKFVWDETQDLNEVISTLLDLKITRRDLCTLKPGCWLNDEVINFYFNLIAYRSETRKDLPRVYSFSTFFFPTLSRRGYAGVKRWTKNVNIFTYDIILFPIHLGCHWCLAVYDKDSDTLRFLDSMRSDGSAHLDVILNYLTAESQTRFNGIYPMDDVIQISKEQVPVQMNGFDCGVFTCRLGEYAARRAAFNFAQRHMPEFRKRILFEIADRNLL